MPSETDVSELVAMSDGALRIERSATADPVTGAQEAARAFPTARLAAWCAALTALALLTPPHGWFAGMVHIFQVARG